MAEHDHRRDRREARRAQTRRARLLAGAALMAFVIALVVVVSGGGSDGGGHSSTGTNAAKPAPAKPKPKPRSPYPAGTKLIRGAQARNARVPILMYHVIKAPSPTDALPALFLPPAAFKAQMAALEQAGYTGISQSQMWDAWQHGKPIPRKPVVVSFDDGYLSQYKQAFPVLRRLGWPGVINVVTHNLGSKGIGRHQLERMHRAGWDIGAHTLTHQDVSTLSGAALEKEIAGSKRLLEKQLGVPVRFFCYPSGKYDDQSEQEVRRAGFLAATTVNYGLASRRQDPFALDRVRVDGGESADTLMSSLRDLRAGKRVQGPGGSAEGL